MLTPLALPARSPSARSIATPRNRVLAALPPAQLDRLRSHLEWIAIEPRQVLYDAGAPITHVYFPETTVISLVRRLADGATIEVGTAGCEGMAGLSVFLGCDACSLQAFAQIPGLASRLEVDVFLRFAREPGALQRILLRYAQAFLAQIAQTAACNAAHLVEERCARWLLMTHDRVDGDQFPLTHELLARMLGVRRAGVTVAMNALQHAGVLCHRRGSVAIVDRDGLEAASCECYRAVRMHHDRLQPQLD